MWLRAIGGVLVLVCLPFAALAQGRVSFRASLTAGVPDGPTGIVLGDFDGDGLAEVATSHSDSGSIRINYLFREEPIEFAGVGSVPAGSVPSALLAGLFDEDEILDFVVANVNDRAIRFIRGTTRGQFDFSFDLPGPPVQLADFFPLALASADLDGDQNLDVVAASKGASDESTGEVAIFAGGGDGTFSVTTVLTAEMGTVGLAVGRIDADSQLDVVAVNSGSNTVSTFFGRGGFEFDIGPNVATGAAPLGVALGDLDGDGVLDVVTADSNSDSVSVLLSNGNRTFAPPLAYPVGTNPTAVAVGDVNGDLHADVVVTNKRSSDVSVLFGDGTGRLPRTRHFVADEEPVAVVLGSLLGAEGGRDIVTVNAVAKTIAALFHRGETFDAVEDIQVGGPAVAVQAGDVDNDGFPDLVAARRDGGVFVFRSLGDGFEPGHQVADLRAALDLALIDFNGDERLDLAVLNDEGAEVSILHGRGHGSFSGIVQNLVTGARPTALTTGDVDGDGDLDIAVVNIQVPAHAGVFRGRGDGSFGSRQSTQIPCAVAEGPCQTEGPVPVDVVGRDFNCDGATDLLVANSLSSTVAVLLSNRDGTFRVSAQLSQTEVGRAPNALVVSDFNRDGQPDFAAGAGVAQGSAVNVLFGSRSPCDGSFRPSAAVLGGDRVAALVARDFTGDALIDMASAYEIDNSAQLFPAAASMVKPFDSGQIVRVSRRPLGLVAADFNGDGSYDLATANADPNASNLSVLTNALASNVLRGDGNGDGKVTAADVTMLAREIADGDGDQVEDIVLRNPQSRRGVDANGDGRVDRQDVVAHVARIFRVG